MKSLKLWGLALALAVGAAYANSFQNPFEFDDFHTIVDNPAVRSLRNVPRFFTDATTFSVLPANRTYRPMVSLSLAIDYALGHGYVPLWFHLSTFVWLLVLLYLLWLLYRHLMDATESPPANAGLAIFAAAWFGLHPAMAETVNYVIQRGDLYCTLGCVTALVIYARVPRLRKFGLYLLPLAMALLSKPPAAVFPALLLFYVLFFETDGLKGKARWSKSLLAAVPAIVVTGALLALQSAMTPKTFTPSVISAADYRRVQPLVWMRYFGELFLPLHLNIDSDLGPMSSLTSAGLAGVVFVAALVAAIWWSARQKRTYPIAYGLLWFVITQLPTSLYPLSEVENDHRMFFPFIGLVLAVVWAGRLVYERFTAPAARTRLRPALVIAAVLMLSGYAWGTHLRNQVWSSQDSLWLDDTQKSPHNGRGLMIYGVALMNHAQYPEALDYFTRALQYTPRYPTLEINLGVVNGAMDRTEQAEAHFQRAVALAPDDDTSHAFYGRWLKEQGRTQEAIAEERTAIALNPSRELQQNVLADASQSQVLNPAPPANAEAAKWIDVSLGQYQQGQFAEAVQSARKALAADPKSATAYNNLGAAQGALGQWDVAITSETTALRLDPDLQIAKNNLASFAQKKTAATDASKASETAVSAAMWIDRSLALNQAGRFEESLAAAREALRLNPASAIAWNNVAAADEALHRWDDAIDAAKKAIALRPDFQLAKNNLAWSEAQKAAGK